MPNLPPRIKLKANNEFCIMLDGLKAMPDKEIATTLALAHYMRIYLQAHDLLPDDILSNSDIDNKNLSNNIILIDKYLSTKSSENDLEENFLHGAAGIWRITLFAIEMPEYLHIGQKLWTELNRGFPEAYNSWQRIANEVSFFNYDFQNDFRIKNIKEDIVIIPFALGLRSKQPQPLNNDLERFEDILQLLRRLRNKMPMLLAVMHFVRINLIRLNEFPQQVWDDPHPSAFSLGQYTNAIKDYADNLPISNELSNIVKFCYDIWYYTVLGLMEPDKYKDKVQEIWNELSQGISGAYEFWETRLYTPELYNLQSKIFIENMKEDIQRIPAALKNKIGFI